MPRRCALSVIGCLAAVLHLALLGGCNIVGYVASAIPETVSARYTPPKTPMLVLVENRQNPGTLIAETDQLTSFIMDELAAYKVAPLIELKKLYELRDNEKDVDKMTVSQIGKALGAQQVVYVDLQRTNEANDGGIPMHARLDATVQVVDVRTSATVFPPMGQGSWPISMETPITVGIKETNPQAVRESLLRSAGTSIGRLFHDYQVM